MRLAILAVDCDRATLSVLVDRLCAEGYETEGALTFETAKRSLETGHYDLLITDVRLMAYNGLHLVARTRMRHPQTAAIVLTSSLDTVIESEARHLGAGYLVKSADPAPLLAFVREIAHTFLPDHNPQRAATLELD